MGGVAVANGSTLSATGEMQVSCNVPYVLTVDDVEWSPIASVDGVDTYILSTSGVVRILVDGNRIFYFVNSLSLDFQIGFTRLYQRESAGSANLSQVTKYGSYVQDTLFQNCGYGVIYVTSSSKSAEEVLELGFSCNQGEITNPRVSNNLVMVDITGIDQTEYLSVFCGNVLVAFATPAE